MAKHNLNYTIIREALGEYLNNKNIIPIYNKKQIKEEAYKLEDLENSKAFIIDKSKRKNLKLNCSVGREILYEILVTTISKNNRAVYVNSGPLKSEDNKQAFETASAYFEYIDISHSSRITDMIWLIEELLHSGPFRDGITKEQIERLVIATENLPRHEEIEKAADNAVDRIMENNIDNE